MPNINLQSFPSGNVLLLMEDYTLAQKIKTLFSLTSLSVVGRTQYILEAWKFLVEANPILVVVDESQIPIARAIKGFSREISTMLVVSQKLQVSENIPDFDSVIAQTNLNSFFSELARIFEAKREAPNWVQIEAVDQYCQFGQGVSLSKRQKEILKQLTLGKSNLELADQFHISVSTVRDHLHRIYSRLGVKDKPSAIVVALRGGIVN